MQYYLFKEACATKETGPEYPQVQKWITGYNDGKANSYYSYYIASERGNIFPDFEPDMNTLIMHTKAKPTDVISTALSIGLLISEKLKTLFEQFNFPPHRFYRSPIIHKGNELSAYTFMHIISKYYEDYLDDVDYTKSLFAITDIAGNNPEALLLTSKKDYLDNSRLLQDEALVKKNFRSITAQRICFNEKFNKNLDFFKAPFGIEYYISQRFKDALIDNKVTGIIVSVSDKITM